MSTRIVPYSQIFYDADGNLLEDGKIYIGTSGLNPKTNPVDLYWDQALTIPAAQPVSTVRGYPERSGAPATLYISETLYSVLVENKNGSLVLSSLTESDNASLLDSQLRADLASNDDNKGSELIGQQKLYSAEYLQTVSDINNGNNVSIFRFVPASEHKTIHEFTSTADLSVYFQDAANSGASKITMPRGKFIVGTQIDYDATETRTAGIKFIGSGIENTIFDNRVANGFLFNINQDSPSKFHLGSELSGFSVTQTTAPVLSGGIQIRAATYTTIKDVLVNGVTGSGIKVLNSTSSDTDQNTNFAIIKNTIRDTGLVGIDFDYTTNAASGYKVEQNRILNCAGALKLAAAHGSVKLNGFSQSITNPQVVVAHNGLSNNYDLVIKGNFFEKGRAGELRIDGCIGGRVEGNTFTSNDSTSGPFAVKLGYDQSVRSMTFKRNRHIVDSAISGSYNCYDLGTAATNNDIIRPEYSDIQSATKINFAAGAENNGNVITTTPGEVLHSERYKRNRITTGSYPVTPDLVEGAWTQYFFSAAGAITINKPANGNNDGAEWILTIRNASGGAITVTFGTGIITEGYSDPANGIFTTASFRYDSTSATWRQIGAWST